MHARWMSDWTKGNRDIERHLISLLVGRTNQELFLLKLKQPY